MSAYQIRLAADSDSAELAELIRRVYAEYPNCVLDVEHEERDLLAIRTAFDRKPGKIWIAAHSERIVGCAGVVCAEGAEAEVKKLYVDREHRRRGLARKLCGLLISEARSWNKRQLVAWSDSRFVEAHRFYEHLGFVRLAGSRELFDLSQTVEYPFRLAL